MIPRPPCSDTELNDPLRACVHCGLCLEACPTGARVFGNLLDPDSEIRWVLENKRVFVLKEHLGTRPRFFYFFDE